MYSFQHKHAAGYSIEFDPAPGGGFVARRMVVVSRVPLNMTEPDYNPVYAANLEMEATAFAKSKGIGAVTFTRKFETTDVVQAPGFLGMQVAEMPGFIRFE